MHAIYYIYTSSSHVTKTTYNKKRNGYICVCLTKSHSHIKACTCCTTIIMLCQQREAHFWDWCFWGSGDWKTMPWRDGVRHPLNFEAVCSTHDAQGWEGKLTNSCTLKTMYITHALLSDMLHVAAATQWPVMNTLWLWSIHWPSTTLQYHGM